MTEASPRRALEYGQVLCAPPLEIASAVNKVFMIVLSARSSDQRSVHQSHRLTAKHQDQNDDDEQEAD